MFREVSQVLEFSRARLQRLEYISLPIPTRLPGCHCTGLTNTLLDQAPKQNIWDDWWVGNLGLYMRVSNSVLVYTWTKSSRLDGQIEPMRRPLRLSLWLVVRSW